MLGSLLTRTLVMALGYAYPAYECYKTVEKNKPEIDQLRFWCQYWILVAALTIIERVGDTFISWLPMYSEVKLALFIYLWCPKTRGTTYVYETFFRPYVAKHENEIDRNLLELRTRAGDVAIVYWKKASTYGQKRFFEILQFVASQSQAPPSRPPRTYQQNRPSPPVVPNRQPTITKQQPHTQTAVKDQPEHAKELVAKAAPEASPIPTSTETSGVSASNAEYAGPSNRSEKGVTTINSASATNSSLVKETIIEEAVHVNGGGQLRKSRSEEQPTISTHGRWSIWRALDHDRDEREG